jgi:ubiquinone/menaquinone biosynthesis C-methylase UbiE
MARDRKREVLDSYDDLGGRMYDIRYRQEQEAKYDTILDRIRPLPHELVLDEGCGTGLLLMRLDAYNVGMDFSHKLLVTARQRLKEKPRTHLVQADAEHLPFRHMMFNTLFAVTLIQNLPTIEEALAEMKRVSRPGSHAAITSLKKAFTLAEFGKALEDSGFRDISLYQNENLKDWFAFATLKTLKISI